MKTEMRVFMFVTVFLFATAVVYLWWSHEPIGGTALILAGGLCGLCGTYFWFISRRVGARPEDRDAEIAEGAGELGFFSPFSYWPFALGLSAALMGLALAFWYYWRIVIAAGALLTTIGGLLFEYYVGQNATQS